MGYLEKDLFVCVDCEATGLDIKNDKIIEIAVTTFTLKEAVQTYESLIDPECFIPPESQAIHNISQKMVMHKPKIKEVLPKILKIMDTHVIVGHGVEFDIALISRAAKAAHIPCNIERSPIIDTLRLARLYGESPSNSLETLREHFNIPPEGAHRAMNDVVVNIKVFKHLIRNFKTTEQILNRLKKPVLLKAMPLGKHKGRKFSEIPIEYLRWAANADFDKDLLYSLRHALNTRKDKSHFQSATNPFSDL